MKRTVGLVLGVLGGLGLTVLIFIGIMSTSGGEGALALGPLFILIAAAMAWIGAIFGPLFFR